MNKVKKEIVSFLWECERKMAQKVSLDT